MFSQQSCPKCQGKIYIDHDFHGWFVRCRTCGCTRYLQELDISQVNGVEITCQLSGNEVVILSQIQDQATLN